MHIVHVGDISTAAAAVMEHCHTCVTTNAGEPEVAGFFLLQDGNSNGIFSACVNHPQVGDRLAPLELNGERSCNSRRLRAQQLITKRRSDNAGTLRPFQVFTLRHQRVFQPRTVTVRLHPSDWATSGSLLSVC